MVVVCEAEHIVVTEQPSSKLIEQRINTKDTGHE